ncbi:F0F1 ATP synthase subunit B [Candidatus Peregrinibacteria bacterium]|jgi:F-type H+-transporting ATPase subunit b|nr:F0F1 ATP synthase subunit B [Candidatus Peregrinibacteria bacterium]MBT4055988.1 F0F1 ATP synthase subunit B [Candidatus Peregrinibacteria bacterium]
MELIDKLGIDLQLLIAQVVNFFILLFILTKLVYKPILNLLDKRKKMIEKNVEDTQRIEERLEKLEEEKTKILSEASSKAMEVIEVAKKEAEEEKQQTLANAKKEISSLAERYRSQLQDEKAQMMNEIKGELAEIIIKSSEKIIKKEFSGDDQKRLEGAISKELTSIKY